MFNFMKVVVKGCCILLFWCASTHVSELSVKREKMCARNFKNNIANLQIFVFKFSK